MRLLPLLLALVAGSAPALVHDELLEPEKAFRIACGYYMYRDRVPLTPKDSAAGRVTLKVTSQGCSDKGVCYVPLEQDVSVTLPRAD